uniref:hypothetical protein n=1 Tax=Lactiplantibacillus pentosus TaxID=1589 RepID=UPI0036F400DB
MLTLYREHLNHVKTVLVDGGYTGNNFSAAVHSNLKATVQVAKNVFGYFDIRFDFS